MNQQQQAFKKLLLNMAKQCLLAILCATSLLAKTTTAQDILNRTVTLQLDNVELKQAIQQLERSANVQFIFSSKRIQAERKVSISAKNTRLSLVLDETLTPLHINYEVISGQIMLNTAAAAPLSISPKSSVLEGKEAAAAAPPIKGTVKDEAGNPLVGVSILVKGTTRGVLTDTDGNFSLDTKAGEVLVFSFVGFLKREITVGADLTELKVILTEDAAVVGEVTVIGSRGKPRTDVNRPVPVDVINAKELQLTGQVEDGL